MVLYGPGTFLYVIFLVSAWITTLYSLNFYYLAYHSDKNRAHKMRVRSASAPAPSNLSSSSSSSSSASAGARLPHVTIQLPLYNEKYVARRLIDAVCKIDYPKSLLQIQVLDDSDDDTVDLISSIVNEYRLKGFDIVQLHRTDRSGYKAGALKEGMKSATGEYIAIFDADFIPPSNFIRHLLRYFDDPKMGFVQCKWGHINENYSTMTQAEALSLDIHFLVEQRAKSLSHIFLNFNGTAGIWRKGCIDDAGGWHTTTLVEDMDLSYRAQMKGWKCMFLDDFVVNAELPVQINAVKRQQFRWAKGSIQVALKLMVDVMLHRKVPLDSKLQSFIHMTRYIVNPLFLAQFLIFPMLLAMQYDLYQGSWAPLAVLGMYVALGPGGYLLVINKVWKDRWKGKARQFLYLNFFAAGLTVNNSVAVFDALFGRKNEFLRTPKFGITDRGQEWCNKEYVLPFTKTTLLEIFFAIYGVIGIFTAIFSKNALYSPLIAIPTIGFIYVAYLSIAHSQFGKKKRERGNAFPAAATTTATNRSALTLALAFSCAALLLGTLLPAAAGSGGAHALFVQDAGAATPNIVVKAALLDGTGLHMWMDVISPQGRMQSGLAPLALVLNRGTHSVTASDYGQFTFDHWEDGSRDRTRAVSLDNGTSAVLTAYYNRKDAADRPEPGLTISALTDRGAELSMWTIIQSANGTTVKTGFTPLRFTEGVPGQTYKVFVADWSYFKFNHWATGGSSNSNSSWQTVRYTGDEQYAAAYFSYNPPDRPLNTLTINTYDSSGQIISMYATVNVVGGNSTTLQSGYTPWTLPVKEGEQYSVTAYDYKEHVFDQWENGSKNRIATVTVDSLHEKLVGYYKVINGNNSGSGGGSPENCV